MGFEFSGLPEPPSAIQIVCLLSISCAAESRIVKEFGIFTESSMLNNFELIV